MNENFINNNNFTTIKVAAGILIFSLAIIFVYLAQEILFPIILGFIFAVLLMPIVRFLNLKLHLPNAISSLFSILFVAGIFIAIFIFLGKEIGYAFDDLPEIEKNLRAHQVNIQSWIYERFGMTINEQKAFLVDKVNSNSINSSTSLRSLGNLSSLLINIVLIPIYTFLILIYRQNFTEFIYKLRQNKEKSHLREILLEINSVLRSYISGLFIEMLIVAVLTGAGLAIIGAKYFVFLGVLTALLNLIPYIGILVAMSISILLTLVGSADFSIIFGVIIVNVIVQFIDNNFLIPKIVGSKVSINAFVSIVGVIVGGAMAGIGGMFLALPMLAILKVIFDNTESLNAFGILLGEGKK